MKTLLIYIDRVKCEFKNGQLTVKTPLTFNQAWLRKNRAEIKHYKELTRPDKPQPKPEPSLRYFQAKERRIKKAITRVNKILNEFEHGQRDPEGWNDVHDLMRRLQMRIQHNWCAYKDWHYKKYEFNVYST